MRRENRQGNRFEGLDLKKVLYISGSVLSIAIIGFVITFLIYGSKAKQETNLGKIDTGIVDNYSENTEQTSTQFGKTVEEASENEVKSETEETKYAINTSQTENKVINNTTTNNISNTDEKKEEQEEKQADPTFKIPVEGEIIKEYAKDKLVYSDTLEEWITHTGIDIKAEKSTVVKAAADGTVKSIKNDPRYGLTVVIEHNNGFTSVYSNLLTAEFVVKGETVEQGQTIGTVGNTATFEIADEAHLHFEITKDGENLDPELYLKD